MGDYDRKRVLDALHAERWAGGDNASSSSPSASLSTEERLRLGLSAQQRALLSILEMNGAAGVDESDVVAQFELFTGGPMRPSTAHTHGAAAAENAGRAGGAGRAGRVGVREEFESLGALCVVRNRAGGGGEAVYYLASEAPSESDPTPDPDPTPDNDP